MDKRWLNSSKFIGNTKNSLEKPKSLSRKEEEELEERGYTFVKPPKGSALWEAIEESKDRIKIYIVLKDGKRVVLGHRYPIYLFQGTKSRVSNSLVTLGNSKKYFKKKPLYSIDNTGEPDVVSTLNEYLRVLSQPTTSSNEVQFVTFGVRGGVTITSPKDIARFESESGRTVYIVLTNGKEYQLANAPATGFTTISSSKVRKQFQIYSLTKKDSDYPGIEVYVNNRNNESTVQTLEKYLKCSKEINTVIANIIDGTKVKVIVIPVNLVKGFILK